MPRILLRSHTRQADSGRGCNLPASLRDLLRLRGGVTPRSGHASAHDCSTSLASASSTSSTGHPAAASTPAAASMSKPPTNNESLRSRMRSDSSSSD